MTNLANERFAWFNGEIMPESQVRVPYRDQSWIAGDGCFDVTRTFGHRLFKVKEHVDRLYLSLRYLQIDPGISPQAMCAATEELYERNRHLLGEGEDYWVGQRISRGVRKVRDDNIDYHGANVIIECEPIPFWDRGKLYRDGIRMIVPAQRRTPPEALSPRAKTNNYLNLVLASKQARAADPEAWALLLDVNGCLCESTGSNVFVVRGGVVLTPRERYVLPGVSRQTVIDIAAELAIPFAEADLDLYDAYNADEAFITSTSYCLCPVSSVDGVHVGPPGQVWGPISKRLTERYVEIVGYDFVQQNLRHLSG